MKVLILGQGGREHALGWALAKDTRVTKLWFAPGNGGTGSVGENVAIPVTDIAGLVAWAGANKPDLVVAGPEVPLCLGVADAFRPLGIPVFGPDKSGARLEGSKVFMKEILAKAGIPTGKSERFTDSAEAHRYSRVQPYPQVIKADGLAAGKGVIIARNPSEASMAIYSIMDRRIFGAAGDAILIEEFLDGEEVSVHGLTDGKTVRLMPSAQDHKRVFEKDEGPNTGGMGAYSPAPVFTDALRAQVEKEVFAPLLATLRAEGIDYKGVLYAGLMVTKDGPKVLEFNCRFGDPETQVLIPQLETPLLDLLLAVVNGTLDKQPLKVREGSALCVVLAAPGYPDKPELGGAIDGLDAKPGPDQALFHAGTAAKDGKIVSSGGRVLTATGFGPTLENAGLAAYGLARAIRFPGMHYRRDIGHRALGGRALGVTA
jgi:phosphoribosylamine--glycine ligase